jgi:hypothetical protein
LPRLLDEQDDNVGRRADHCCRAGASNLEGPRRDRPRNRRKPLLQVSSHQRVRA